MTTTEQPKSSKAAPAPTAEDIKKLLREMPDDERRKASLELGIPLPKIDERGKQVRVFGYRCRYCNDVGLEFLGDSWETWRDKGDGKQVSESLPYPPTHVPFDELQWVQEGPPKNEGAKLKVTKSRRDPMCQHCGNALAKGPAGGIKPSMVIKLADWNAVKAEDDRRRNHPSWNYNRDANRQRPWGAAGPGKAREA